VLQTATYRRQKRSTQTDTKTSRRQPHFLPCNSSTLEYFSHLSPCPPLIAQHAQARDEIITPESVGTQLEYVEYEKPPEKYAFAQGTFKTLLSPSSMSASRSTVCSTTSFRTLLTLTGSTLEHCLPSNSSTLEHFSRSPPCPPLAARHAQARGHLRDHHTRVFLLAEPVFCLGLRKLPGDRLLFNLTSYTFLHGCLSQHGMLKHAATYEIITPESVGADTSLVLGKHSGKAAFKVKRGGLVCVLLLLFFFRRNRTSPKT